jgi:hypothetical protein
MSEAISNEIPKWVKIAILLVFIFIFLGGCTRLLLPEIKERFINDQTKKDEISNNFDILLRNLEDCSLLTQDDCVCEGFGAWPSFQKETILKIETRGIATSFNLTYEKKQLRYETLDNLKLSAKLIKTTTPGSYILENLASDPKIIMDWKTNPPVLSLGGDPGPTFWQGVRNIFGKNERKAVSGLVYREQGKIYFLTSFEPADKLSSFIGSMKKCGSAA